MTPDEPWRCPQRGCDRPLEAHLVTLAAINTAGRPQQAPDDKPKPRRTKR